jgi:hypothetical protein
MGSIRTSPRLAANTTSLHGIGNAIPIESRSKCSSRQSRAETMFGIMTFLMGLQQQ